MGCDAKLSLVCLHDAGPFRLIDSHIINTTNQQTHHRKMRILDYVQPDPSSFKFDPKTNTVCVRHGEARDVRLYVFCRS